MITRTTMESRLKELKQQLENIRQQFVATAGHIEELEFWLAEEAKPADEPKS